MTEPDLPDPYEQLALAAGGAATVLHDVSTEGSVLDQIRQGQWNSGLSIDAAQDLTDLLTATMEHVRRARDVAGRIAATGPMPAPHTEAAKAVAEALKTLLPLNRKERFYTGTVLPMLTASDGGAHLHRLLHLCGLTVPPLSDHSLDGAHPIQIFTEYSFSESRFTDQDKARFPEAPEEADTPDVVLVGPDWLLALEAKVFHRPAPAALAEQMRRQQVLVNYWQGRFGFAHDQVRHVLLLPASLPAAGVGYPVVTWQQVLHAYRHVGPAYWVAMLEAALDGYDDLASRPKAFGQNASGRLTGQEIVDGYDNGTLATQLVGRIGGAGGQALAQDIASGRWVQQRYAVSDDTAAVNRNWMQVAEFVRRTRQ